MKSIVEALALNKLFHPDIYPGLLKRSVSDMIFLLWKNNTLGDYISWSLFQAVSDKYYVRKIIWKQQAINKANIPVTYAAECLIPNQSVISIVNDLNQLKINNIINLQSESYGLIIDGIVSGFIYNNQKISWRDNGNEQHELCPVINWYQNVINYLEELF